jgi:transcriptional regulator with GAF, ATPase, and Fis domain
MCPTAQDAQLPHDETRRMGQTLEATERDHIIRALRESHGQIGGMSGAAGRLGMKRTTLQSKMKHLGIKPQPGSPQH